nr:DUF3305 domain-containing protein [Jannaschia aquimarina]
MPMGIVLTQRPGVTRWAPLVWRATSVLPGAGPADWKELRREGDVAEIHAGTLTLELHGAEAEAYAHNLAARTPCLYAVMREGSGRPQDLVLLTASPYEAQDYAESGEELVEKIPMPAAILEWVEDFVARHHVEEPFKKRRRDRKDIDVVEDGIGDARIRQIADVYRSPTSRRGKVA